MQVWSNMWNWFSILETPQLFCSKRFEGTRSHSMVAVLRLLHSGLLCVESGEIHFVNPSRFFSILTSPQMNISSKSYNLWLELEPGVNHGEDGQDGRGQATSPDKAWTCRVNPQPVQWDEDITTVLHQVQQQWRVAVQHSPHQMKLSVEPAKTHGLCGRWGGRGKVVRWQRNAGGGRLFAGCGTCFALHEEMELVDISGQVQDQSKEVVPAGLTTQFNSILNFSYLKSITRR